MKKTPLGIYLRNRCAKFQLCRPIIPLARLAQSSRTHTHTYIHSGILAQLKLRILHEFFKKNVNLDRLHFFYPMKMNPIFHSISNLKICEIKVEEKNFSGKTKVFLNLAVSKITKIIVNLTKLHESDWWRKISRSTINR